MRNLLNKTKLKHGLSNALMIFSFIFSLSVCLFLYGYYLSGSSIAENKEMGLILVLVAFPLSIISASGITYFKKKINILMDYGNPLLEASEYIKDIIKQVNVKGIDSLNDIIKKTMESEVKKVAEKERKGK